jgi:F0F1-type ATP synthase membrane subunit b/b'
MKNICSTILNFLLKLGKGLLVFLAIVGLLAGIYFGIDLAFKEFLLFISRAVLANFAVFALVIGFVLRQAVHPKAILEQAQTAIENEIKKSEVAKEESDTELDAIQKSSKNLKKEVNAILKKSEENAKNVGEKILQDAETTAIIVRDNTDKIIENNQILLKNELIRRASLASIEVAKSHIINELNNNQELHDKLIDESIEALVTDNNNEVEEEIK